MSPFSEFEGKTVENAIEKACEDLNTTKEKLKYNVISYGSSGIFGLVGVRKAKIRVMLPEPPGSGLKPVPAVSRFEPVTAETPAISEPDEDDIHTETHRFGEETEEEIPEISSEDEGPYAAEVQVSQEAMDAGREMLQRTADFITEGSTVSVSKTDESVCFEISGGNTALMIGKRGQTLEAIQYIAEKIVNRHTEQRVRVRVDVEGYLDKRKERLETLAKRAAEKVKRSGKPSTIGQMNSHDRRIIHISLKDDPEVRTQSMGEGFYRKLVIFPKKKNSRKKGKSKG